LSIGVIVDRQLGVPDDASAARPVAACAEEDRRDRCRDAEAHHQK